MKTNGKHIGKVTTLRMKGGNTDTIYNTGDQRRAFAESLQQQHPYIVKVVWKFNRWHHQVNYKPFKVNKLILKENLCIPDVINNVGGMVSWGLETINLSTE